MVLQTSRSRPHPQAIGRRLTSTGRAVSRAFDAALAEVGGSLPTWLVLLTLRSRPDASQREIAAGVGIQGATLTHHLNAMESAGLLTRRRDPTNRRVHVLEPTERGEEAFGRMRGAAGAFDRRLPTGLDEDDAARLAQLLARLRANVEGGDPAPPDPSADGPELTRASTRTAGTAPPH